MAALDAVIAQLKEILTKPVVLDYEPTNKVNTKLIKDAKFRQDQRNQKAIQQKAMSRKSEERKTLTNKIADKIAPEEGKPTIKLE